MLTTADTGEVTILITEISLGLLCLANTLYKRYINIIFYHIKQKQIKKSKNKKAAATPYFSLWNNLPNSINLNYLQ